MIQAICWVLVHSLWQGVLLALAGGLVILCTKRTAAAVRYRLLCGLAGIFLVAMGGTFLYEWGLAAGRRDGTGGIGVSMNWLGDWCTAHAFQVVIVWLTVAVIKSVQMAAGWNYIRRMRREGCAAPALWRGRVDRMRRQLGIPRAVKLVESALVRVPIVIGHLRPIIYIPLGLINHLPASEMEAVVLHELAHIRRNDHLVNMLQQAAECLLFFNPGFLWISTLIREERENCCDDMAIAHTQDRVEFVRALVRFKEHSMRGMVLAFPGNRRQLLHRVLRISRQENKTLSGKERLVLLGGCLVILCLLVVRADTKKKVEPLAQVQLAQVPPVSGVSKETVAVLEERERVSQNIEWVKAKLDQLRHKPAVKKKAKDVNQKAAREEEVNRAQAEKDKLEADKGREQNERDKLEADKGREQNERDKLEAAKDREQNERDRLQAELDRQEADRDRQQAIADRLQAERDRKQADLDRLQADKDRDQAELERKEGEQNRLEAAQSSQKAEGDRRASEDLKRKKTDMDRQRAERDRQQAERDRAKNN